MLQALKYISLAFPAIILLAGLIRKAEPLRLLVALILSILLALVGLGVDSLGHIDCSNDCISGVNQSSIWFEAMILALNIYILSVITKILEQHEAKLFKYLIMLIAVSFFIISVSVSNNS